MNKRDNNLSLWILSTMLAVVVAGPLCAAEDVTAGDIQNPFIKPCVYRESLGALWRHKFHYMRTKWDHYFEVYPDFLKGYEATTLEKIRTTPAFYIDKKAEIDVYWGKPCQFYRPFTSPFHEEGFVNFSAWAYNTDIWTKEAREQVHILFYIDRRKKDLIEKLVHLPLYTSLHLWVVERSHSEGMPWFEINGAEIIPETALSEATLRHLEMGAKQFARKRYDLAAQTYNSAIGLQMPVNVEMKAFSQLGRSNYELRRFQEARNAFAEALIRDDTNIPNLISIARCDQQLQRYDEALEAASHAVTLAPANPDVRAELGLALAMSGDTKAGLKELDYAQKLAPRNQLTEANRGRALIALRDNKLELAKQEFSQAVILRASDPNLHMELGDVLQRMNQLEDAKREFGFAKELAPSRAETHLKYAQIARMQGDAAKKDNKADDAKKYYSEALDNARNALKNDDASEDARTLETDMLHELGRDNEAGKSLDTALLRWPANFHFQDKRYEVAVKLGEWEVMEVTARKCVEMKPEGKHYMRLANVLANKPKPDYAASAQNYDAALKLDEKNGGAWFELAQVKLNSGDVEGSISAADKAVDLLKTNEAKLFSARARLERDKADPVVDQIAKLVFEESKDDAVKAQAQALIGAFLLKSDNVGESVEAFDKANTAMKENGEFQLWYGLALLKKNEPDLAKSHLKSAVEICRSAQSGYLNKLAKKAIEEVEKLEPGYEAKLPEPGKFASLPKDPSIKAPVMTADKPVIRKILPPVIEDDGPTLISTEVPRSK